LLSAHAFLTLGPLRLGHSTEEGSSHRTGTHNRVALGSVSEIFVTFDTTGVIIQDAQRVSSDKSDVMISAQNTRLQAPPRAHLGEYIRCANNSSERLSLTPTSTMSSSPKLLQRPCDALIDSKLSSARDIEPLGHLHSTLHPRNTHDFGFLPIPQHLQYDPEAPPTFGFGLNVLFALASTFRERILEVSVDSCVLIVFT
jgi:hypothetical protein